MKGALQLPAGYPELLRDLKSRIRDAQLRASFAVSGSWFFSTGRSAGKSSSGSGPRVGGQSHRSAVSRFAARVSWVEGYSPRNLKYMRTLAEVWPDPAKVPQLVALFSGATSRFISIGSNTLLCGNGTSGRRSKRLEPQCPGSPNKEPSARAEGKALTNFQRALPSPDSDLSEQVSKGPLPLRFPNRQPRPPRNVKLNGGHLAHLRDLLFLPQPVACSLARKVSLLHLGMYAKLGLGKLSEFDLPDGI